MSENNKAILAGEFVSSCVYDHTVFGEDFYKVTMESARRSGVFDRIDIIISERLVDISKIQEHVFATVKGEFRSHSLKQDGKKRLLLFLFAEEVEFSPEVIYKNEVMLKGYVREPATFRKTPVSEVPITDLMITVLREYHKSDRIPCIAWNRNALFAKDLMVNSEVKIQGRMQSRDYVKRTSDGEEKRTAYEVSIYSIS